MKAGLQQIPIQGAAPRLAGNREWDGLPMPTRFWGILAVAFGVSLSVIDGAIANVALPTMARMLGISSANSIWIVNAYQLAIVVSLLSFSALGDVIGYRKIYIGGLGIFIVAFTGLHVVRLSRHAGHGPRLPGIRGGSHHERQYHTDPPDIPPPTLGTRNGRKRYGRSRFLGGRPYVGFGYSLHRHLALAFRYQHPDRTHRVFVELPIPA